MRKEEETQFDDLNIDDCVSGRGGGLFPGGGAAAIAHGSFSMNGVQVYSCTHCHFQLFVMNPD